MRKKWCETKRSFRWCDPAAANIPHSLPEKPCWRPQPRSRPDAPARRGERSSPRSGRRTWHPDDEHNPSRAVLGRDTLERLRRVLADDAALGMAAGRDQARHGNRESLLRGDPARLLVIEPALGRRRLHRREDEDGVAVFLTRPLASASVAISFAVVAWSIGASAKAISGASGSTRASSIGPRGRRRTAIAISAATTTKPSAAPTTSPPIAKPRKGGTTIAMTISGSDPGG